DSPGEVGVDVFADILQPSRRMRLGGAADPQEITGEFLRVRCAAESHPPRWLEDVREYVHANFARRITLAAIGKAANAHPVHVAQTFRRHHQCTIGEYLRRLRIEFACRELASAQTPLAQVA